jgi:altronate dehydratase
MSPVIPLHEAMRIPLPGDNVAIATRRLAAGTQIVDGQTCFTLDSTVLEGHRVALMPIPNGEFLLSWGLPFGVAIRDIAAGSYVCNAGMLDALRGRNIDFQLPQEPNFADRIQPYVLDEDGFRPAEQVTRYPEDRMFMGYRRPGSRGVGTRNFIALLGTTSRTGSYVRQLEERLQGVADAYPYVDGIVAIAHTEGGNGRPNNLEFLLRTLAGFMVHPNVGAVLAVDYGLEPVTNEILRAFMMENGYPLEDLPHAFLSLSGGFQAELDRGEEQVRGWLETVNATPRTPESAAHLKIALQCGGSDAFSGISGNPLASWVAREIIRYGGSANLAETDELIGAEPYVLQKVKNPDTARKFLDIMAEFKERAAWHGSTAEGNPSGGNKYRGLYNIVLKSIGAANKRHPDVRLDEVIAYSEPMRVPGFTFMDSPGNDLESIAGQVASGCNLIFFVTGNGSITNFPFVPTIKIITTTKRYKMLSHEMDVNAGAYLDGNPMDELGRQMLELTLDVASGQLTVGELAGHSQVQIWRDWPQTDGTNLAHLQAAPRPDGRPVPIRIGDAAGKPALPAVQIEAIRTANGWTSEQVGLILPTSLCSGQVARMAADRLNQLGLGQETHLSRYVSLVHTEGCGNSGGPSEELYARTLLGYLTHPLVRFCLLLEHGCEKTHNDYMRGRMAAAGLDPHSFGWASVQLDGGIEQVLRKMEAWFAGRMEATESLEIGTTGLASLRLGLLDHGPVAQPVARAWARLVQVVVGAGGTVVVPENAGVLSVEAFRTGTIGERAVMPSLAYGERMVEQGFHIMETPTAHWVETLTGLGATGVEMVLAHVGQHPQQGHPLVPVLQVTAEEAVETNYGDDLDLVLGGDPAHWTAELLQLVAQVASRAYRPKLARQGNIDFQLTRGLLGVSL